MASRNEDHRKTEKNQNFNLPSGGAHTEELVDHYWGSMNHVNGLIRASEIKAGLILSFYGILLNFIYDGGKTFLMDSNHDFLLYVLIALWFVVTALSIYFCIRCFIPKIEGNYDDNVFFFGDVITKFGGIKEFARTFYQISLDEKKLFNQLGEQIFIISKIADWKFKNVKRAILFLAIGLGLLFLVIVYQAFIDFL
jgi:hypothetical protein